MSLEEKIAAHTAATEALTDAVQHLTAVLRTAQVTAPLKDAVQGGAGAPAPKPDKKTGATKAAPPAPLAKGGTANSPATAPAADAGSDPLDLGEDDEPEGTYEDLKTLVPAVGEKHGRAVALAIFSGMGFPSGGRQLAADAPDRIPEAVKLFRAKLSEPVKKG